MAILRTAVNEDPKSRLLRTSIPDFQYWFPSVIFKKPETGGIF